jgi:hypothetical protein
MARRTQIALQRQLKRERAHQQWLEQHLPQSTQLARCRARIRTLAAQCAAAEATKQKSAATATLFPNSYEQLCCSVHLTSSVKLVLV